MAKSKTTKKEKPFKSILRKEDINFLEKYLNNASPTGFESEGQKIWLNYLTPYIDEHYVDNYGSVVGIINPKAEFKIVIEAHADEIGWYISHITEDGLMHVIRNGGSDHLVAPSKWVNIHTKKGIVPAYFGWPAIHTRRSGKEDKPEINNIFLDCGARTKAEVEKMGIHIGNVVTFQDTFHYLNNRYFVARAVDNRIGGFMIAQVARLLHENKKKLPFGLYIVNAVQEEVGLNGAKMIAESIKPNVAIVTDVAHDTSTPLINKRELGDYKCGNGPILTYAPAVHNKLLNLIVDTAEKNKIPFQREAASRVTGTDTDAFAFAAGGIPSALISLPLRYMHTTVETVDQHDVEHVIKLIYECLLKLDPKFNFKYL